MARPRTAVQNESLLSAALEGLEVQRQRIEEQIREVRSLLGRGPKRHAATHSVTNGGKPAVRRTLSEAARKRIAAAQKRRWAEYRKAAASHE